MQSSKNTNFKSQLKLEIEKYAWVNVILSLYINNDENII
jgi:hypothetical protein